MYDDELDEVEDLMMLEEDEKDDEYYTGTNYLKKWFMMLVNWIKKKSKK